MKGKEVQAAQHRDLHREEGTKHISFCLGDLIFGKVQCQHESHDL